MKKLLVLLIFLMFLGCATARLDTPKDYKAIKLDCVTKNSWNVPKMFPDKLGPSYIPLFFTKRVICIAYIGKNLNWYILVLSRNEKSRGICQEDIIGCELSWPLGNKKYGHRFWKYIDKKPVEVSWPEYKAFLRKHLKKKVKINGRTAFKAD